MALRGMSEAHHLHVLRHQCAPLGSTGLRMHGIDRKLHIAAHGQPGHQRIALEHNCPFVRGAADGLPPKQHLACIWRGKPGQQGNQRRLAAARESDQRDEFPFLYVEIDIPQHRQAASALGKALRYTAQLQDGHQRLPPKSVRLCSVSITRSSRKPMNPMVNTATSMRLMESALPFWNSSQTNFPRPGFCASISAAISTIQPTPSDSRIPVKISGRDDGSTSFIRRVFQFSCSTRATFSRSRSMEETPSEVLITVGHSEHRATVMEETRKDFSTTGLSLTYSALTTSVTMGSQARGEIGLNTCTKGLKAASTMRLMPQRMPMGTARSVANRNPVNTVFRLVTIWSM